MHFKIHVAANTVGNWCELDVVPYSGAIHSARALTPLSVPIAPHHWADMIHCTGLKWIRDIV